MSPHGRLHKSCIATARCINIAVFFLLFGTAVPAQQVFSLAEHAVIDMSFLPNGQGWIIANAANRQFLFRTTDAGRAWERFSSDFEIEKIFFLDEYTGWAIGFGSDGDVLLGSMDGGKSWSTFSTLSKFLKSGTSVKELLFTSPQNGWILATQPAGLSLVLKTIDGGKTFKKIAALSDVFGLSATIISTPGGGEMWIAGSDSILYSGDSGQTWLPQLSPHNLPGNRRAISFRSGWAQSRGRVWVAGESVGGVILASENHGETWKLAAESEDAHYFNSVQFWDDSHGCAVGASTLLFCTSDGGNSWKGLRALPKSKKDLIFMENVFEKVAFVEAGQRGWVVAVGGYLFQTEDGGNSWHRLDLFTIPIAASRRNCTRAESAN